jgi:murein L,D-transpeptidase YafK
MRIAWIFAIIFSFLVAGCNQPQPTEHLSWNQAMVEKLNDYSAYSREKLTPYFANANLPYAPHDIAFVIFKKSKKFVVYARNNSQQQWRYIKTFPIYAASGGAGPKLHEGDDQVPEGIYHIIGLNPRSHFDLSMHLNYPNQFDLKEAKRDNRSHLGGDIFIHGNRRSIGCIAIGDKAIQQVFPLVYSVGEHHVTVVIAPSDLRKNFPIMNREHLPWVPTLYARLRKELEQFPVV